MLVIVKPLDFGTRLTEAQQHMSCGCPGCCDCVGCHAAHAYCQSPAIHTQPIKNTKETQREAERARQRERERERGKIVEPSGVKHNPGSL